ncbi:MAG: DUF2975 domain-containing protein [Acidobacteriota bacterium]
MIRLPKINAIEIVRAILDFIVFTGGTMTVLMIAAVIFNFFVGTIYSSVATWPVRMSVGNGSSLALTEIEAGKPLGDQFIARVRPDQSHLMMTPGRNYALLGFDLLWVLLVDGSLFIVAYFMRKIFMAMQANDFFDQHTPARLRIIGWTIILSSILKSVGTYVYGRYTASLINSSAALQETTGLYSHGKPLPLSTLPFIDIPNEKLFIGIAILALAIAFQKGLDLKQEQALTV